MRKIAKNTKIAITMDTDWASDEIIDYALGLLLKYKARATWFITHDSKAIRRIMDHDSLFEIGIHPNFLTNSTQGSTVAEVMSNLLTICPGARIMRAHSLCQSVPIFTTIFKKYPGIKADISLFLPDEKYIKPHKRYFTSVDDRDHIMRIPYVWEDDYEMYLPKPNFKFDIKRFSGTGMKILNFHPIHIALNSDMLNSYTMLKNNRSYHMPNLKLKDAYKFRQTKRPGVEDFLKALLNNKKAKFVHIVEELGI